MANDAHRMLAFLRLAEISQRKGQFFPRDKFLLLAGTSALAAGYPDVAEHCYRLVTTHQPAHLLSRYSNLADAITDGEFQNFLRSLRKFCSFEQGEYLLQSTAGGTPGVPSDGKLDEYQCAERARTLLSVSDWKTDEQNIK